MPLSMKETLEVAECTRGQFQQWVARRILKTAVHDSGQGRARIFTRENVIELAFIKAFIKNGASLNTASALAQMIWRQEQVGKAKNFLIFDDKKMRSGKATDELPQSIDGDRVVIVNARSILARIDAAIKAAAEEERD